MQQHRNSVPLSLCWLLHPAEWWRSAPFRRDVIPLFFSDHTTSRPSNHFALYSFFFSFFRENSSDWWLLWLFWFWRWSLWSPSSSNTGQRSVGLRHNATRVFRINTSFLFKWQKSAGAEFSEERERAKEDKYYNRKNRRRGIQSLQYPKPTWSWGGGEKEKEKYMTSGRLAARDNFSPLFHHSCLWWYPPIVILDPLKAFVCVQDWIYPLWWCPSCVMWFTPTTPESYSSCCIPPLILLIIIKRTFSFILDIFSSLNFIFRSQRPNLNSSLETRIASLVVKVKNNPHPSHFHRHHRGIQGKRDRIRSLKSRRGDSIWSFSW